MSISPDSIVYWQWGPIQINATIVFTWLVMALLGGTAWWITRRFDASFKMAAGQNAAEIIVDGILSQIREVTHQDGTRFLPFIGTLFIFIATCNALTIVPGFQPPTGSLTTTTALALCVFIAVPYYGIADRGLGGYLKTYISPSPLLLPFNVMGDITRTVALAIRLFGNIMSGTMIAATMMAVAPLIFPILLSTLGLLTGLIQAYIFSILALVFIASAAEVQNRQSETAADTEPQTVPDAALQTAPKTADIDPAE